MKITFQNERILFLLEQAKSKTKNSKNGNLDELVANCINLQGRCNQELEAIRDEYKKELNLHLAKRQIIEHLKNT